MAAVGYFGIESKPGGRTHLVAWPLHDQPGIAFSNAVQDVELSGTLLAGTVRSNVSKGRKELALD